MTDDRFPIAPALARQLIDSQFPQWSGLPIRRVDIDGWDNRSFRLGDTMKIRMPSAARYAPQVEKEYRWLPGLAEHLPLAIPRPLAIGTPGPGYPWHWSIQSWIDGETVSRSRIADPSQLAADLAAFLSALRQIDATGGPSAGPDNFHRGGDLAIYDQETRHCLGMLAGRLDAATALSVWEAALARRWSGRPVWVHGDVAAGNLLLTQGRLSAVIDFGSAAVGDPACDLVIAWTLLKGEDREIFRRNTRLDDATWARARGWALWKALLGLAGNDTPAADHAAARDVVAALLLEHAGLPG